MLLDNVVTCDLELITPSAQRDTPETFSLCQSSGGVHTHWVRLNSLGFYSCQPQGILKGSNMRRTRRARSWLDSFAAKQTDEHVLACDTGTHSCCLQAASVSFLFGCRRQLLASVSHTQCVRVCLCTCVCVCVTQTELHEFSIMLQTVHSAVFTDSSENTRGLNDTKYKNK